jgi:hypothetical protein
MTSSASDQRAAGKFEHKHERVLESGGLRTRDEPQSFALPEDWRVPPSGELFAVPEPFGDNEYLLIQKLGEVRHCVLCVG